MGLALVHLAVASKGHGVFKGARAKAGWTVSGWRGERDLRLSLRRLFDRRLCEIGVLGVW